jgi:hypothetical protein
MRKEESRLQESISVFALFFPFVIQWITLRGQPRQRDQSRNHRQTNFGVTWGNRNRAVQSPAANTGTVTLTSRKTLSSRSRNVNEFLMPLRNIPAISPMEAPNEKAVGQSVYSASGPLVPFGKQISSSQKIAIHTDWNLAFTFRIGVNVIVALSDVFRAPSPRTPDWAGRAIWVNARNQNFPLGCGRSRHETPGNAQRGRTDP